MEEKCSYFGICAGCTTQHLTYETQLQNKSKAIAAALKVQEVKVFPSPPFAYRNRVDFLFHPKGLGLRKKNDPSKIIDTTNCPIAIEQINILLQDVRSFFRANDVFNLTTKEGSLRYAVIRATTLNDSSISFVVNSDSSSLEKIKEKIIQFASQTSAKNILITYISSEIEESTSKEYEVLKGCDFLQEQVRERVFVYPVQGFFQNNLEVTNKMQNYITNLLSAYPTTKATLLDLYGGVGTFGIINSLLFSSVFIVEAYSQSILFAKKNIEVNKIKDATAHTLDAKQIMKLKLKKPLYVITDPPRSGMDLKAIENVRKEQPEVIIYISCNYQQLAKELPKFKGYTIKSTALFDMFPQTNHCEVVVELIKTK